MNGIHRCTAVGIVALAVGVVALRSPGADPAARAYGAQATARAQSLPDPPDPSARFTLFESGQVRPLVLSGDHKTLFAVNTPDNRLEIFQVKPSGLRHVTSVPVGLEPVAVAVRSPDEVWVVNHLSDSISIIDTHILQHSRVVRTLLVGDEPRDIVFGGSGKSRAFITTAHRGQNSPYDPQLTTPGVGRADVWVFDAHHLGTSLGGDPLTIITLFTDTPRALAVTPDGATVYAAGFHTGNRTAVIAEPLVPDGFGPDGMPGPSTNFEGEPAPENSLIVQFNAAHWIDTVGRTWDNQVKFALPDKDVFAIDANVNPPALVSDSSGFFSEVGTILYNMAVNPVSGKIYVSNTDANNLDRFEGPGIFAGHSLRGHLHESRITVLSNAGVTPRHLNKHINYDVCCAPVPNAENDKSLATPTGLAVSDDGATLYVATLSSDKVGVFSTAALENDTFVPSTANHIPVSGGGPTGLVLDDTHHRLYVLTRFDNAISIINTVTKTEVGHVLLHNPEPPSITAGRRFLYDASFTSSHGDSACTTCHVFGDLDSLAWDLGNPDAPVTVIPGPFASPLFDLIKNEPIAPLFHPMKGPMVTQSLRGMANHGPMHWRGDRTGGNDAPTAQPDSGTFDERAAFKKFQAGFTDLLGRSTSIPDTDMEAFTDFILQITYPPNPIRALDNALTFDQAAGRDLFTIGPIRDPNDRCEGCHRIDPNANPSSPRPGFFGTDGATTFDFASQLFKVAHLRNVYQKVGCFGMPAIPFVLPPGQDQHMGDQIRGICVSHDAGFDTIFRFLSAVGFSDQFPNNPHGIPYTPAGDVMRRQIEAFLFAFPSNLAPIVGQQVTLTAGNAAVAGPRIDLLLARADVGECDVVVKGRAHNHQEVGFLYRRGVFLGNRQDDAPLTDAALRHRATVAGQELTYTCSPPGSGRRLAIDRDSDGFRDGDEEDAGSDPSDPSSMP
jgi:DNA-binding beta-propeller fold protein YncE